MKHDWYAASAEGILANIWLANPMTVALLKASYVPNRDTHKTWSAIAANEVAQGTGYVPKLLTGKAAPYDPAGDRTDYQAADVTWGPGVTFDAGFAVIYDGSSQALWSLVDFEGSKSVFNGTFVLDISPVGLLYAVPA